MKKAYRKLKERLSRVSRKKLVVISLSLKAVEVVASTYLIKKFFLK